MTDTLEGRYPVNIISRGGSYSPHVREALITREQDGYYDVLFLDEDGRPVDFGNRPRHTIEQALDGEYGYDVVVSNDPAAGFVPGSHDASSADPDFDFTGQ